MPILQLRTIKCVEMSDYIGTDDMYILLDGKLFQEPLQMRQGDVITFGPRRAQQFRDKMLLELWDEEKGGQDLMIGKFEIGPERAGKGLITEIVKAKRGRYELSYEVVPDEDAQ